MPDKQTEHGVEPINTSNTSSIENRILREPPLLKGFFPKDVVTKARKEGKLLTANVYFYPECWNFCLFCAYEDNRKRDTTTSLEGIVRPRHRMDIETYSKLFKEIAAIGAKTLFVPGMGEPLLSGKGYKGSNFVRFVESANEQGLYVIVISSLNPEPSDELVEKLKSLDVSIIAKLESMDINNFNKIVQPQIPTKCYVPYNFVEIKGYGYVPRGLKKLMEAGFNIPDENGQVRLGSGTVINTLNIHEAPHILRFYRDTNIWPYMQIVAPFQRATKNPFLSQGIDRIAVFKKLLELDEREYGYTWDSHGRRVAFDFIYPTIIIDFGGDVIFNAFFRYPLGTVINEDGTYNEGSLGRIVGSKDAKWLRQIYFPIGGGDGCSPYDHAQCKKIRLTKFHESISRIPNEYFEQDPLDFCVFENICTTERYVGKKS